MFLNYYVKLYSRILVTGLIITSGLLYYLSNRKNSLQIKADVLPKIPHKIDVKENIHRALQENDVKSLFNPEKKLVSDGLVYR